MATSLLNTESTNPISRTDSPAPASVPAAPGADTHAAADAARAVERTNSWKPSFGRRQSWKREDQKHDLQMTLLDGGEGSGPTAAAATAGAGSTTASGNAQGAGFSEREV